jgi:MFS family permease
MVPGTLDIIAIGLSLTQVGGFNIVLESTPRQFSGISLGMTVMLNLIGGAVGPTIAGIYMQTKQVFVNDSLFPSPQSYNLIFLSAALLSLVSILLILIIKKRRIPNIDEGVAKKKLDMLVVYRVYCLTADNIYTYTYLVQNMTTNTIRQRTFG